MTWLQRKLRDPLTRIFIAERNGEPVASVRLDLADFALISITVAPEHRGQGLATPVIRSACALTGLDVVARIRVSNIASIKAFERAGFEQTGVSSDVLTYTRRSRMSGDRADS